MVFLILESLGSTELFFILVIALIFFGPRKLPQLSRTLGKHLASFRQASEDFKRTWEKEVDLELNALSLDDSAENNSIWSHDRVDQPLEEAVQQPALEAIPRDPVAANPQDASAVSEPYQAEPLRKRDWL